MYADQKNDGSSSALQKRDKRAVEVEAWSPGQRKKWSHHETLAAPKVPHEGPVAKGFDYMSSGQYYWSAQRAWIPYKDFSPMSSLNMTLISIILIIAHMNPRG